MDFVDVMRAYFRGEATEAWFFILPTGLLLTAVGGVLLSVNRTEFDWGIGVPSIVFGLLLMGTGIGVGARTPSQVSALEAKYQSDPSAMVVDELPRMEKVMQNFRTTHFAFGVFVVVGLVLLYAFRKEWTTGLGVALILGGAIGLTVDAVAERRGEPYVKRLEELAK